MLWQPLHSATPPEWKALALLLMPKVISAAAMISNPNLSPFIFLLLTFVLKQSMIALSSLQKNNPLPALLLIPQPPPFYCSGC
jgi:hypothetical protein